MNKSNIKNYTPIFVMLAIFIIDFLLIITTHHNWNSSMKKFIPLKSEIQSLKSDITLGHLWFEEAISGDKTINIDTDVMKRLEHLSLIKYLEEAKEIFIKEEKFIYEELSLINEFSNELFILAQKRLSNYQKHKTGSPSDQTFDKKFSQILVSLSELEKKVDAKIEKEFIHKESIFKVVIFLFFLANFLVFIFLFKYKYRNQEMQEVLESEKEKAVVTLHSIGDAVITTDEKGYITYLNPIAETLTAYTNSEACGKYHDEVFYIINEKTKIQVETPIKKVLKKGEIIGLSNHVALINRNREQFAIEDSAAPIRDKKGSIIGVVLVFHDITKQKEDRAKLNENEKLLIQQSKMAAMGEMLENIAHQWRQPLSVISTTASGLKLKKELKMLEDKELVTSMDLITNSTLHLSKTIDDFRSFFNPNKTKEVFSIKYACEKTLSLVSSKFKNRGIVLVEKLDDIEVDGFENELIQVLMILLNNSIDVLEKKEGNKIIQIESYNDKTSSFICISDNGGGINKDIIKRVFEAYFTTKDTKEGTGIGLYMAEEIIVKHMKGKIKVINKDFIINDENCHGASFIIEFPIS